MLVAKTKTEKFIIALGYRIKGHDYFLDVDGDYDESDIKSMFYNSVIIKTMNGYHVISHYPFGEGK